jgi:hypothetical protein
MAEKRRRWTLAQPPLDTTCLLDASERSDTMRTVPRRRKPADYGRNQLGLDDIGSAVSWSPPLPRRSLRPLTMDRSERSHVTSPFNLPKFFTEPLKCGTFVLVGKFNGPHTWIYEWTTNIAKSEHTHRHVHSPWRQADMDHSHLVIRPTLSTHLPMYWTSARIWRAFGVATTAAGTSPGGQTSRDSLGVLVLAQAWLPR